MQHTRRYAENENRENLDEKCAREGEERGLRGEREIFNLTFEL